MQFAVCIGSGCKTEIFGFNPWQEGRTIFYFKGDITRTEGRQTDWTKKKGGSRFTWPHHLDGWTNYQLEENTSSQYNVLFF